MENSSNASPDSTSAIQHVVAPAVAPDAIVASSPSLAVGSSGSTSGQIISIPSLKFPPSLMSKLRFVLSQKGIVYGVVMTDRNLQAVRVGSKQMNNIIRAAALERNIVLKDKDLAEINETTIAQVEMLGAVESVWYRVAPINDGVEIDIGDLAGTRIVVKPGKVDIVTEGSQTLFYKTQVSSAFEMPAQEGNLELLKKYLNLHAVDQVLLIALLSYTLAHPKISTSNFPILVINGDQGTGKSTLCNHVIYPLIDPNVIGVQIFPGSAKDLAIAAQHAHVICYDNMRNFKVTMADILCVAATGGAISNRALYTDGDLSVQYLHVALVLNGIHSFITQPDLAQRCVPIRTMPLTEDKRQSEGVMLKALKADMPSIFRGLLDLIAQVFLHLPEAEVTNPERMLDFVHWLAAMEKAEGIPSGTYQLAYSDALRQAQLDSLMENMLAATVVQFCGQIKGNQWSGTPSDLLDELNVEAPTGTKYSRDWPQNPISLSKRLNGLKASLLTQGIELDFSRGKERTITIRKLEGANHA